MIFSVLHIVGVSLSLFHHSIKNNNEKYSSLIVNNIILNFLFLKYILIHKQCRTLNINNSCFTVIAACVTRYTLVFPWVIPANAW